MENTMEDSAGEGWQGCRAGADSVEIACGDLRFRCRRDESILAGALRAGLGFPYECCSGGCGSCKFELLEGAVAETWTEAPGLRARDHAKGKRLACQSIPLDNCVIRFREDASCVPLVKPVLREAVLTRKLRLTPDMWEFQFEVEGEANFLAGQYALMRIAGAPAVRAYSMSNISNDAGQWHFQIKRVPGGAATSYLFDRLEIGERVELDGPLGTAFLRTEIQRDIVCVAGGSGLAPMLSIVRQAAIYAGRNGRRIYLFYGGREPQDIVEIGRSGDIPGLGKHVQYLPVVSVGETEAATLWEGPRGMVHEFAQQYLQGDSAAYEYYLAGPPPMVDAARRMLVLEKSVPVEQIHYDRFF